MSKLKIQLLDSALRPRSKNNIKLSYCSSDPEQSRGEVENLTFAIQVLELHDTLTGIKIVKLILIFQINNLITPLLSLFPVSWCRGRALLPCFFPASQSQLLCKRAFQFHLDGGIFCQ